jgi:hypothetical protein
VGVLSRSGNAGNTMTPPDVETVAFLFCDTGRARLERGDPPSVVRSASRIGSGDRWGGGEEPRRRADGCVPRVTGRRRGLRRRHAAKCRAPQPGGARPSGSGEASVRARA